MPVRVDEKVILSVFMASVVGAVVTTGCGVGPGVQTSRLTESAEVPERRTEASGSGMFELYGASIPRDAPAALQRAAGDALLAAARLAVAVDPGMPETVWAAAIRVAVPEIEREPALAQLAGEWEELARAAGFEAPLSPAVPVRAWEPGVRVVGFDRLNAGADRASVRIWAREEGSHAWLQRTVAVERADDSWVLRLPIPPVWARSPVPEVIVPFWPISS